LTQEGITAAVQATNLVRQYTIDRVTYDSCLTRSLETVIMGLQNPAIPAPLGTSTPTFRAEQNFFPYSPSTNSSSAASISGSRDFPVASRGSYQNQQSSFPTQSMNPVAMNDGQNWQADRSSPNSFHGVPRPTNERRYSNPFSVSSDSHDSHSHHSNSDSLNARLSGAGTVPLDNSGDARSGGNSRQEYDALLAAMSSRPIMSSNQLPPPPAMISNSRMEERYPFPPSTNSPLGLSSGFQQSQIPSVSSTYPSAAQQPYPVLISPNPPGHRHSIPSLAPPPLLSPHATGFLASGSPNPSMACNPAQTNPANNAFSFSFFADNNSTGNSDNSSNNSNNRF
jgi:hypothetical protein